MACLGAAAILVLGRSDEFVGASLGPMLLAVAVVGLGLGRSAMIGTTSADTHRETAEKDLANRTTTQSPLPSRARLLPLLPGSSDADCRSWLGGLPKLTKGAAWPVIAGRPAQFLAQIDCTALPDALWRGAGPRRGSMVFFRAVSHEGGDLPVRVLHVEGTLTPCLPPVGQDLRPRWPLLVQTAEPDDLPGNGDDRTEPNWSILHEVDLTSPGYQPFDWTSAEMLLGRMDTLIVACSKRFGTTVCDAERTHLRRTSEGLAELQATLEQARTEGQAFDEETRNTLQHGLCALTLPDRPSVDGASIAHLLPLSRHRCAAQAYFAPFERHCREIYAENPECLPADQRALFEPFWAHNARHETGCIGSDGFLTPVQTGEAEVLLELPSSELLGWMFGEGRALRIYVDPEDLEKGVLDRAWGSVAA
ncbi:DUF1963 domain-containing protein [Sedimentitalea todarodis]|uniref:DUF1963 domain-containing protein n=1 Tax=Sedimentitalea todarodis TaxID=1631240 RepID=A0ABU3VAS6_9RHOB|nr:DUF1963 domain-containing protein [Sedimentitalea todarodis]MDU9003178.1 DUF1963 domain-containing protein [Sedimentitalea todarodis]